MPRGLIGAIAGERCQHVMRLGDGFERVGRQIEQGRGQSLPQGFAVPRHTPKGCGETLIDC
ncbi:MAG TPA: hypothetical protein VGF92_05500 [Stellaceae bacterium]|jgi:hypothetical protein